MKACNAVSVLLITFCSAGCAHLGDKTDAETAEIEQRVADLENEPLVIMNLGAYHATPTERSEAVIAYGDKAVPVLVKALENSKDKPVRIGYAVWCLNKLHSDRGTAVAKTRYDELDAKGQNITPEERFAAGELFEYLRKYPAK